MATIRLPNDFKELLKLFHSHHAEYLLVGGYAVNYYGYSRSTGDMDIWVGRSPENAAKVVSALREFGFVSAQQEAFLEPNQMVRMGVPPLRLEILTSISGVEFSECYPRRVTIEIDDVAVSLIRFDDLKHNKLASGRLKDLADLEALE
ncbi:MAG: hypothetical protein ABI693_03795 [Bryobacteraceae bacterium]